MATGYTPRVLSPTGKVMFGTWAGPQDRFWEYRGRYGFMGGGTYTGKTDLLRWWPWQQVEEDDARIKAGEITRSDGLALFLLRETPRLREVMNRCARDFKVACPSIDWKALDKTYVWPNGYRMVLGHMQHDDDWQKYQGWQITCLLWDELPTFLLPQFEMMDQWVRAPGGSRLTPIHRAGGNPVGVGRPWVKKFFVDAGPEGKEVTKSVTVEVEDADGSKRKETVVRGRIFIFAKVSDNKSVDQAAYLASFDGKPKAVVRAMRDGDFESSMGDLIGQVWDADEHVVKPFAIPSTRNKFRVVHFSYAASMVIWVAVDFEGNLTVYRDLRLENHTAEMLADRVRELEEAAKEWDVDHLDEGPGWSKLTGVLGPASAFPATDQRGPSASESMRLVGLRARPADENFKSAADQIRTRLVRRTLAKGAPKSDPGIPGLRYFSTCLASLETVPSTPASKEDPDLPDKAAESAAYKVLAYACMSRPLTPERKKPKEDDWETFEKPKSKRGARSAYPGGW